MCQHKTSCARMSLSERLCGARQGTCKGRSSLHAGKKPPCGRPSCYKAYKGYKEDLKSKRATASLLIKNNQLCRKIVCCCSGAKNAETHNIPLGEQKRRGLSVGIKWFGGRALLHTTRSVALIFWGVVFNVSSHLCEFCCRSDCM